tara:strand:+ start:6857 stop:7522 length:666 start_codon:yes stop_codon:yes gene_type:complete
MIKKIPLIGIYIILFQSCSIDTSRIAPGYVEAFQTIKDSLIGADNELVTAEIIERIPYASSKLAIGKGAPGLIILESINDNKETWVSADGLFLVIEDGRVIKSAGLFNNLVSLKFADNDFKNLIVSRTSEKLIFYYSYDNPELIDMRVEVERRFITEEKVRLLSGEKQLSLIEEKITNDYIGWKELNKFWVDNEGFVWKSEQFISPKLPRFNIEVTKKPAK